MSEKLHYVVATGIIVKDRKYLIAKRSEDEKVFPGFWTVPGGKLEPKDYKERKQDTEAGQWYNTVEDLLRREVMEEVGLEIDKIQYLTSLTFVRPDNIPTFVLSMFANHKNGEVKLGEGITDYAWVGLEEARNYKLIPGIYEEIAMLDKFLKGEKIGEWKKRKIGIDLDDVVFEFTKSFVDFYNKKYKKQIKFENIKTYSFEKDFDISLEEFISLIKEMVFLGIGRNLPLYDYAKETILRLAKDYDIIFLTSRIVREGTLENLNELFSDIDFKLIYSSNPYAKINGKTKAEICKEEFIDFMIEDSKEYAKEIALQGTKVLLLDRPWNRDFEEHFNIIRINNWKEVLDKIK